MPEAPSPYQPTIIIDLRCLQDTGYAERGIGQHVRSALRLAREVSGFARNARLIGLTTPSLPGLPAEILALVDEHQANAYLPETRPGTVLLNPSPMTHDQLYLGRLLLDPGIRKTAMVYDFIPYELPELYLPAGAPRLNYLTSLAWLNQYDHYMPISDDTAVKIKKLLRNGDRPAEVTGVPIAPVFEQAPATPPRPRHVLNLAGHDPRKNPELLIRAHAGSKILQARKIPLVIGGHYPAGTREMFRALAAQHGGDPALVQLPGRVPEDVLHDLYTEAYCVVTPSRAEGFSMPVIEAMAAGVPSIASDIFAHAALVTDARLRFDPDDVQAVRAIIERIVENPEFRAGIIAAQAPVWRAFKADAVATRIWSAIEALAAPAAPRHFAIRRNAKPKIAFLSPLPPAHSGVADYSAACAAALAEAADVSLFTPSASPLPVAGMRPEPLSDLPYLEKKYDRVISVLGNSQHHYEIYDRLMHYGGACICHDSRLLHFYAFRDGFGLPHAAKLAAEELRQNVSETDIEDWVADEASRYVTLFGEIAAAAAPLIFHAGPSAEAVRRRFGRPAHHLPFAIYRPWNQAELSPAARAAAKRRLNLSPHEIHIASFGFLAPVKGSREALEALQILRRTHPNVRLHWVGNPDVHARPFKAYARKLGLGGQVTMTSKFLPETIYRDYLIAADLGLQLRNAGRGSISGALQDCIAAGLPTVANHDLTEMLDAPSTYVTAVSDHLSPAEIAGALATLIETRPSIEPSRTSYCAAHSMSAYAASLLALLDL